MTDSKQYIFTDCDLDGAGAYLTYRWVTGINDIPYTVCRVNDLYTRLKNFTKTKKIEDYDRVLFFDLDTSDERIRDIIDLPNVTIVDHHISNDTETVKYSHANLIVKDSTSTCRLIYTELNDTNLTDAQKLFIALVNDYDSYTLRVPTSKELNTVFWSYQGDRVQKLVRDFPDGFTGFSKFHNNIITIKKKELINLLKSLEIYSGEVKTKKHNFTVASAVATSFINDVADYIVDVASADVGIVVNTKSNKVSFRRRTDNDSVSMVKLAGMLTDESGGHDAASGGMLCDKFLAFTKTLKPVIV
jgi:oligoribonuclease NrnB/cAMP/cGMP phosphodiesterase (DHH superfamily)